MSEIGQRIIAEIRKVAEEQPDFVYTGECQYVEDGHAGCLVGQALWKLGLVDETFEGAPANALGVGNCLREINVEVNNEELAWLEMAQCRQDSENAWGKAVSLADDWTLLQ